MSGLGRGCVGARASIGIGALTMLVAACVPIHLGPPTTMDEALESFQAEVPEKSKVPVVTVDQLGTDVVIVANRRCQVRERTSVRRTTIRERTNTQPASDWVLGVAGVAGGAVGAGIIADAQTNLYSNEITSQNYNPIDRTAATVIGAIVAAAGLGVLIVPIVDAGRASGVETDVELAEVDGDVVATGKPCSAGALAGQTVTGRISHLLRTGRGGVSEYPQEFELGRTDAHGQLELDLSIAAAEAEPTFGAREMTLLLGEAEVGTVSLMPLFNRWEAKEWEAINPQTCAEPATSADCEELASFIRKFPHAKHGEEALAVLDAAEPKLHALRDEETWTKSNSALCDGAPKLGSASAIQSACGKVKSYQLRFPAGAHQVEASRLVVAAEKREQELEAREARAAADAAAAIAKAAAAAEANEKAAERRRCRGQCKFGCSSRRNFDLCFQGCVEAQCD